MNWLKDYSGLTIRLTNRPTLADLTVRLIRLTIRLKTRLTVWQIAGKSANTNGLNNSTDNLTETRLTIHSWQFDWQIGRQLDWQIDWQLEWQLDWRSDNSAVQFGFTIPLTIPLYNSADNSALQFVLKISSDEFVLTNSTYIDQNGWNDPSVRAATSPWSKMGVSCRGLRCTWVSRAEAFDGGRQQNRTLEWEG